MSKEIKEYQSTINNISDFHSMVDIIIPFHGQYEKVTKLLESIYLTTRSNVFTICLVDDASPNEDFLKNIMKNVKKTSNRRDYGGSFIGLRCDEQKGFAGALKTGFDATESPYVCFLNSDCIIEESNWLRSMGECLLKLKPQGVRMVSAMTDNPMSGHDLQKGEKFQHSSEHVILDVGDHLSMYCTLCHRDLFKHCGGFLKEYPYGFYEDEEFAARMTSYGFKQAICRNSWVKHEGGATVNKLKPHIKKIMREDNRQRCLEDMRKL